MLSIENLSVSVGHREILKSLSLEIGQGQVHTLMGPNGSGKSTLMSAIMGFPAFRVTSGAIHFRDRDITHLPSDERARMGLGIAAQRPPTVKGVTLREAVEMIKSWRGDDFDIEAAAEELQVSYLLDRPLNVGYSGGEAKRSELLQLMAQSPDFVMFDEPESGVDLVNMELVGQAVNALLGKSEVRKGPRTVGGILITHTGFILDYVNSDRGHVLCDGEIICTGNPLDQLEHIRQHGYEGCRTCPSPTMEVKA